MDIREAAQRWTEAARFALAADRDDLPHVFDPSEDDPEYCDACREFGEAGDDAHDVPAGFDPEEYGDGLAGLLLDADVLTAPDDSERWRVELSLTVGGPTVYVVADSRWSTVTFHHSWGYDPAAERPEDRCPWCGRTVRLTRAERRMLAAPSSPTSHPTGPTHDAAQGPSRSTSSACGRRPLAEDDWRPADLHEIDLWGDDAAVWQDIAAQCAGVDL